jgi:hypothetical protein
MSKIRAIDVPEDLIQELANRLQLSRRRSSRVIPFGVAVSGDGFFAVTPASRIRRPLARSKPFAWRST